MAKAPAPDTQDGEAPPKRRGKLLIIIAVVLVIVIAAAAAAFFLMRGEPEYDDEEVASEVQQKAKPKPKKPGTPTVFFNLDTFTVNLTPEGVEQYLQVVIALELPDTTTQAAIQARMPAIRSHLISLLSGKRASEVLPREGKDMLAVEIREAINRELSDDPRDRLPGAPAPQDPVMRVLFTNFIVQ